MGVILLDTLVKKLFINEGINIDTDDPFRN